MAEKFLRVGSLGIMEELEATTVSEGAADAGNIIAVGDDGKIDLSLLPDTVLSMVEYVQATAAETLSKGDLVYIFYDTENNIVKCRKAIANDISTVAQGFVAEDVADGNTTNVYFEGTVEIPGSSFTVGGPLFLSNTDAGKAVHTAPNTLGTVTQRVGSAISSTTIQFEIAIPIIRSIDAVDGGSAAADDINIIDGGSAAGDDQENTIDGGTAAG